MSPALDQAKLFLSRLDEPGELPVALDVETGNGLTYEDVAAGIADWVGYVRANYGRPLVYASPGLWSRMPPLGTEAVADLWVADWEVTAPGSIPGWGNWSFWQYSNSSTTAGIAGSVNLTRFNGDLDALYLYLTQP